MIRTCLATGAALATVGMFAVSAPSPAAAYPAYYDTTTQTSSPGVPRALVKKLRCGNTTSTTASAARQRAMVMCLINKTRAHYGRRTLKTTAFLSTASKRKAARIVRCGTFTHTPCKDAINRELTRMRFSGTMGENLYMATEHLASPWSTYVAWMNSPAHRKNILFARWKKQGLATLANVTVDGQRQDMLWVSTFTDR